MPRQSPYTLTLTAQQRRSLTSVVGQYSSPYRDVIRAKIVLYAAAGLSNQQIAERIDMPRQIVSKWRKRFFEHGLEGLEEQPRRGRPAIFPP